MTKAAAKHEPELFATEQPKPKQQHKTAPLAEGPKKGGRNQTTRVAELPPPPKAMVVHQPQPPAAPKSLGEIILAAGCDPNFDIDKYERLLAIKEREERDAKEAIFNAAISDVKAELPPVIVASSKNDHTKSWWARYEDVSRVVDPIIRKHGFVLSYGMAESAVQDHYRVICDVSHKPSRFKKQYFLDGPSDAAGAKGGGSKTPIQGVASTVSYLQRILKCLIFDVVIDKADRDGNSRQGESITEEQGDELLRLCAEKGINRETFQTAFRVNDIYSLPARKFDEAKAKLAMAPKREPKKAEQQHDAG